MVCKSENISIFTLISIRISILRYEDNFSYGYLAHVSNCSNYLRVDQAKWIFH